MSNGDIPAVRIGWAAQPSAAGDLFITNRDALAKKQGSLPADGANFKIASVEDKIINQGGKDEVTGVFVRLASTNWLTNNVNLLSVNLDTGDIYQHPPFSKSGEGADSLTPVYDRDANHLKLDAKDLKWLINKTKDAGTLDETYAKERIAEIDKEIEESK